MGIFDKLKDVKIDKVLETASAIGGLISSEKKDDKVDKIIGAASAIGGLISSTKKTDNNKEKADVTCVNVASASTELTVSPMQDMRSMLSDIQVNASRPVAMALKSQIEILSFVQSPTMPRMVIDNIMSYMNNALKTCEEKGQREILQESFVDLLQCFVYIMEACLRYEISQNKEVSVKLLTAAGDLLVDSVSTVVKMAVTDGNVFKIENVLVSNYEHESFFGRLVPVSGNSKMSEKVQEFYKTLEYLYGILDKYAEVIGVSIPLHGMLKRYADDMVEKYTMAQYDSIMKQIKAQEAKDKETNKDEADILDKGMEMIGALAFDQTKLISIGAGLVSNAINKGVKSPAESEQESVQDIKRNLQSQLKEYENQLAKYDADIASMNDELKSLSIFRKGRKDELEIDIEMAKMKREPVANSLASCNKKLNIITDILEQVEKYSSNIYRIVDKFE